MEIVLQHSRTGLFAGHDGQWSKNSRDAVTFNSSANASRFAVASGLALDVRLVVRIECGTHRILMPLVGEIAIETRNTDQRSGRGILPVRADS